MENKESIALINEMILKAKKSFSKVSFYFLMWGWILAFASITEFVLMQIEYSKPWLPWCLFPVIGGVWSGVRGAREGKKQQHSTFTDKLMAGIWSTFFITLVVLIVSCVISGQNPGPTITVITAIPTIITGFLIDFKPLKIGGVIFWVFGMLAFLVPSVYIPIVFAVAMFGGYIVPGMLLKKLESNGQV